LATASAAEGDDDAALIQFLPLSGGGSRSVYARWDRARRLDARQSAACSVPLPDQTR